MGRKIVLHQQRDNVCFLQTLVVTMKRFACELFGRLCQCDEMNYMIRKEVYFLFLFLQTRKSARKLHRFGGSDC